MIIDFHSHTFPEKIAAHAIAHMQSLSHAEVYADGTEQGLIALDAEAKIDLSVVLPVVTNPEKSKNINDISIAHSSKDGLLYFGGIHPDTEDWHEELGRIAAAGIKGIKLHPLYQGVDIDDIRNVRILNRCAELGLIVVIHAGDDPAFPGQVRCSPEMTRKALKQVEGLTFVAAHMGGLWNWDRVAGELGDMGVYVDTSNSLGQMKEFGEGFYTDEQLQLMNAEQFCTLVRELGSHRVLYGSDSPWDHQAQSIRRIEALPLTREEKDDIFYKNACRLLHIDL